MNKSFTTNKTYHDSNGPTHYFVVNVIANFTSSRSIYFWMIHDYLSKNSVKNLKTRSRSQFQLNITKPCIFLILKSPSNDFSWCLFFVALPFSMAALTDYISQSLSVDESKFEVWNQYKKMEGWVENDEKLLTMRGWGCAPGRGRYFLNMNFHSRYVTLMCSSALYITNSNIIFSF